MNWEKVLIWVGVSLVILGIVLFAGVQWGKAIRDAEIAASPKDTTAETHPHTTPAYEVSGPPGGVNRASGETREPRTAPAVPLITQNAVNDSADTLNCVTQVLLNTVGRLNAELAQYKDSLRWERAPDGFEEDSLLYSLKVLRDPNVSPRWLRWLTIKPYPYMDTVQTVNTTVIAAQKMERPWLVASFSLGAVIMAIVYALVFN